MIYRQIYYLCFERMDFSEQSKARLRCDENPINDVSDVNIMSY